MRGTEILFLVLLGSSIGCKTTEPSSKREDQPASSVDPDRRSASEPSEATSPEPQVEPEPLPEPLNDPERADKLADLDELCKALDHDYVDGTLSDYYRGIEPRTAWGKAQRDAGNESIQPGRLLEKAVAELSPGAKDPTLEHCRKLLDYLDDVE